MSLKKITRRKTKKNISKRIKVTGTGKLLVNRCNQNHLRIKKSRRVLKRAAVDTVLSPAHNKLKNEV
jgi:ribosomal protein L35